MFFRTFFFHRNCKTETYNLGEKIDLCSKMYFPGNLNVTSTAIYADNTAIMVVYWWFINDKNCGGMWSNIFLLLIFIYLKITVYTISFQMY